MVVTLSVAVRPVAGMVGGKVVLESSVRSGLDVEQYMAVLHRVGLWDSVMHRRPETIVGNRVLCTQHFVDEASPCLCP